MDDASEPPQVVRELADRMRDGAQLLTQRWFDRISARLDVEPSAVFPSRALLDHVPLLVERIAEVLAHDGAELAADTAALGKAREIGALRFEQGCSLHELLKELELLGSILHHFLADAARGLPEAGTGDLGDGLRLGRSLAGAMTAVREAAVQPWAAAQNARLRDIHNRLRSVDRLVTHELANRLNGSLGVADVLAGDVDPSARRRLGRILKRHLQAMRAIEENVRVIAEVDEARQESHVLLRSAITEARRRLRSMAETAEVEIRVAEPIPGVEVPAAAVELGLISYLSNAIHYADPSRADRTAEVAAWLEDNGGDATRRVVVRVADNGIGIPPEDRDRLFIPFTRTEIAITRHVEGLGLGLSTVRETVEAYGGTAWAEFDLPEGSAFLFSLPCRRQSDAADR